MSNLGLASRQCPGFPTTFGGAAFPNGRLIPSIALRRRLEEVAIMDLLSMLTATGEHLVGHPAPELGLTDLEGVEISLATLRGTPAVLNFWFLG